MGICKQCGTKFDDFGAHALYGICNECFASTGSKTPEQKAEQQSESAPTRLNVISLIISGISSLLGASLIVGGRGGGMEALSSLFAVILFSGGGLVVAFFLGVAAMFRGEQPYILTILAIAVPPVAGLIAPALGR